MSEREKELEGLLKSAPSVPSTDVDEIMVFRREYVAWMRDVRAALSKAG